jgi:hypothetical protein
MSLWPGREFAGSRLFSTFHPDTLLGSTMRLWSVPPLLLALLWVLSSVATLRAADDPGDLFVRVYQTFQTGSKLEMEGKLDEALQKFRFCVSLLEQIQKDSPNYEPIVIDFRLKKSRAAIERVQSMQSPLAGAEAVGEPMPAPFPASPQSAFPQTTMPYRIPIPGGDAPQFAPRRDSGVRYADDVMVDALKEKLYSVQTRLDEQYQINQDLHRKLLESTARELSGQKEVDLWKVKVVELQSQLTQSYQSSDDLQEAIQRFSHEKAADEQRIESLESDLAATQADLEVSEEYNGELFAKLERASKFITTGEKIRLQLLDERKVLIAQSNGKAAGVAKIQKERDVAVAERDALQKKIEASIVVAKENKNLTAKLESAEKQLAELSKNTAERQKVEEGLRGEVESAKKSLAAMRDQLKAGQDRIAELEKQLTDTANATAMATGDMADENALLKSLVLRQLQEQARRQQARKLVAEELEKLQVRSTSLLQKLDALGAAEAALSPKEKKLVDLPLPQIASDQSDFTVVKSSPDSDLPPELVKRAAEANELSQKRQFDQARGIYEEIAKKAPQSYLAAVNLGIAQRQIGDYKQASAAFRRALELKSGDPFALTNLGTVEYRAGNLEEAVSVLQKAVAADGDNYLAHYLLGVALNDRGDRDGARREVKKSLVIKADYIPAMELAGELEEESSEPQPKKTTP